jgi:tetratricopeptide (TPR) repeat protein
MADTFQLTYLAAQAVQAGDDERACDLLQQAIEADPMDARPHVALAGILASREQMDAAIAMMKHAVELEPTFDAARFQLGMMEFTCGKVSDAQRTWALLDRLEATHPLLLFNQGMLHLAKDRFDACLHALREGIAVCPVPSLAKEMQRVIDKVNALPTRAIESAQPAAAGGERHVLLSRYDEAEQKKR